MDKAAETMIKNCQASVVNQPFNKYTPLQPTPLPRGPWVKGVVDIYSWPSRWQIHTDLHRLLFILSGSI